MNVVAELPIEAFVWKKFSLLETIAHKLHLVFNWIFCQVFGQHDWTILVVAWNYRHIQSVEEFRLRCAHKLKCSCCEKVVDSDDANLTLEQNGMYNFYTNRYFKYRYSRYAE